MAAQLSPLVLRPRLCRNVASPATLKSTACFNPHPGHPTSANPLTLTTAPIRRHTPSPIPHITTTTRRYASMKALIYSGPNTVTIADRPQPTLTSPTDAIVKLTHTTICGTDLHIIKGHVPTATPGRILGHEGVGVIAQLGSSVQGFKVGDTALISCITACGACAACRKGMASHCVSGGWVLGNTIDGTQAEYVRIPHADSSLYRLQTGLDLEQAVMLSDALPTGYECGTLNGKVQPGSTVVVIGAGAVGRAVMLTAKLYSPALLVVVDVDETRLAMARRAGAHHTVNSAEPGAVEELMKLTDGQGFDAVVEAVGIAKTFDLCQTLVGPGGVIANVGVHGTKVDLHLEKLWDRNISITTRLVDTVTTPMLLKLFQAGRLDVAELATHRFAFKDAEKAYDVFGAAAEHKALKVMMKM